jgi:hypothetical protein
MSTAAPVFGVLFAFALQFKLAEPVEEATFVGVVAPFVAQEALDVERGGALAVASDGGPYI